MKDNIFNYWRQSLIDAERLGSHHKSFHAIRVDRNCVETAAVDPQQIVRLFKYVEQQRQNQNNLQPVEAIYALVAPICLIEDSAGDSLRPREHLPLWIPAILDRYGKLYPNNNSLPWIDRSLLEPKFKDSKTIIGHVDALNEFLTNNNIMSDPAWSDVLGYADALLSTVSGMNTYDYQLAAFQNSGLSLICVDETVLGSSAGLVELYDRLLAEDQERPALLQKISESQPRTQNELPAGESFLRDSVNHLGHVNKNKSLSRSKRRALHHVLGMKEGDVFSITASDSFTKRDLFNDIFASLFVEAAVNKNAPPKIVFAANDNSVLKKNIDFFQSTATKGLSARWIPNVHNYSLSLCLESKAKQIREVSEQYLTVSKLEFVRRTLSSNFLEVANEYYLNQFSEYAGADVTSIDAAVNRLRVEICQIVEEIKTRVSQAHSLSTAVDGADEEDGVVFLGVMQLLERADLDLRTKAFDLAARYWEGVWLREASAKKIDSNSLSHNQLMELFDSFSKLTPCFLATFASLPKFFLDPEGGLQQEIDYLIVDESSQAVAHLAAPSFAMAKRAVVVGDEFQLKPVQEIAPHVDYHNLSKQGFTVLNEASRFDVLSQLNFSASTGNFFSFVKETVEWRGADGVGVVLKDSEISSADILHFKNRSYYQGSLQSDTNSFATSYLPSLSYAHIQGRAIYDAGSLVNLEEAETISVWLEQHAKAIAERYSKQSIDELVMIITPFEAQAKVLQKLTSAYCKIPVGSLQELKDLRRPIVIFSPTQDSYSTRSFSFDSNFGFLNVATSCARDSFCVFGDMDIFSVQEEMPSSILAQCMYSQQSNEIVDLPAVVIPALAKNELSYRLTSYKEHQDIFNQLVEVAEDRFLICAPYLSDTYMVQAGLYDKFSSIISRGVRLVIYVDSELDVLDKNISVDSEVAKEALKDLGADLRVVNNVHNKTICVDGDILVEGSYSWLSVSEEQYRDQVSLLYQGGNVNQYIEYAWKRMELKRRPRRRSSSSQIQALSSIRANYA